MSSESNKQLITTYFQTIWNEGRFDQEPRFVDENVVVHAPPIPGIPDGIAGPLAIVGTFRASVPDIHLVNDDLIAESDTVVQRWTRPRHAHRRAAIRRSAEWQHTGHDRHQRVPTGRWPDRRTVGRHGCGGPDATARAGRRHERRIQGPSGCAITMPGTRGDTAALDEVMTAGCRQPLATPRATGGRRGVQASASAGCVPASRTSRSRSIQSVAEARPGRHSLDRDRNPPRDADGYPRRARS